MQALIPRVTATPAALALIAALREQHGPLMFFQSGGCGAVLVAKPFSRGISAEVPPQPGRSAGKDIGEAIIAFPGSARAMPGFVKVEVIDDDQIEPAIPVVVDKAGRGTPIGILQPRLLRGLAEGSLSLV